jgi:glycerol-3-phosphate dehydrogenase
VPLAIIGTESIRKKWRIRPHKVRVRAGKALTFPTVPEASQSVAAAVTDRIWPNVMLQWEWLGGLPPLRRAAVIGAGSWGTSLAVMLARAGIEVDLATRSADQAARLDAARENEQYLPGVELDDRIRVVRSSDLELSRHDLVVLAVPAAGLPAAIAEHGSAIAPRAGVLVCSKGLVPPMGALPSVYVGERIVGHRIASIGGPAHALGALGDGAALVIGSADRGLARQLRDALAAAGFDVTVTRDCIGVEFAGAAKNAAALAAATAGAAGPNAAGAAAGKVFAEIDTLARYAGSDGATFAGLAGAGDLVSTVLASGSRNRRAGELLAAGTPAAEIHQALGQTAEAVACVPLLAERAAAAGVDAPALTGLADLIEGRTEPGDWTASLTSPPPRTAKAA